MYQALYRKWRPRTFDDVVGQEPITTTLQNEIRAGRPAHAYLLMGSRGTGKTTCAKLIAKAVNCLDPRDGNPCGQCDHCVGIDNGSMVDVVEIDAASNSGVDNIRELRGETSFRPAMGRYRVYIIDEVHMLSIGAVNALLKIMEEPPEYVIFILATTEVHKIPATIQSRCQRFDFRRIGTPEIGSRLEHVAAEEGLKLQPDAAQLIARLADGGMRDALSMLDLCGAHSEDITVETVSRVAGLMTQDYLFQLAMAIRQSDLSAALELIDKAGAMVEYDQICTQLEIHFRNLLVASAVKDPGQLIVALPETIAQYQEQARDYPREKILHAAEVLRETQNAMTRTANRRAQLEMAIARLCDPSLDTSPAALLSRIQNLESRGPAPASAVQPAEKTKPAAKTPAKPAAASPTPAQPAAPAAATGTGVEFDQWDQVLDVLRTTNPALRGTLAGTKAYLTEKRVLIASGNPVFLEMMRSSDYTKDSLKGAIYQVTGVRYGIGPYTEDALPQVKEEAPAVDPLEDILRQAEEAGIEVSTD